MFSCVNGAARGPQGQLAMLWCVFLSRGFSHRQDMEKQLWQVIFFQHVHMDKLWQVDCCLKKDLIDYGRVAMRVWTFECSQRKLGSTNRSTACEDWWKDHRLPELSYPYAGNPWKFLNRENMPALLKIICRTSPILLPETARILWPILRISPSSLALLWSQAEIGRTMDSNSLCRWGATNASSVELKSYLCPISSA